MWKPSALDVECPTCGSDPGRNCKDMTFPEVHFTRAMSFDALLSAAAQDDRN